MKKILILFLSVVALLTCFQATYATESVTEVPKVKIMLEGELTHFQRTPINVENRTLLPFREVLNLLGVPNDQEHIVWDGESRSIKVNCVISGQSKEILMKIGEKSATLNGNNETIDVAPMIYQDATYIPLRFIAQALGKTVVWDGSTTTVLIRDTESYNQIKDILTKSNNASSSMTKFKMKSDINTDITMKIGDNTQTMNMPVKQLAEMDIQNKIIHMNQTMSNGSISDVKMDIYIVDGVMYINIPEQGWVKMSNNKDLYAGLLSEKNQSGIQATDAVCAGLVLDPNAPVGKYVLKGNVYIEELVKEALKNINASNSQTNIDFNKLYVELTIDKGTFLVDKEYMDMSMSMKNEITGNIDMNLKGNIEFTDYNGSFTVSLPEDAKNAKEYELPYND